MKYHCRPDGTSVAMGIVDDASVIGKLPLPKEHIFLQEKAAWWELPRDDGIARYAAFNETWKGRLEEWIEGGCPAIADA